MAPVTSDHRFRGSQQCKRITLYFWRSEVQDGFYWTRVYEATLFKYPIGKNQFPCFSQLLEAVQFPWLMAPSSVFTADDVASSSLLLTLTLFLSSHLLPSCAPIFKKIFFGLTVQYAASQFPSQGSNLCPPQQKGRVLTSGPPEKSPFASILRRPLWLHWAHSDNPGYPRHQNS